MQSKTYPYNPETSLIDTHSGTTVSKVVDIQLAMFSRKIKSLKVKNSILSPNGSEFTEVLKIPENSFRLMAAKDSKGVIYWLDSLPDEVVSQLCTNLL